MTLSFFLKQSFVRTLVFLTIFTSSIIASCTKEKITPKTELEKLPAKTQDGKNTFGCLYDDTAWIPHNTATFGIPINLSASFENGILAITCNRRNEKSQDYDFMTIGIHGIIEPGVYNFRKNVGDTVVIKLESPFKEFKDNNIGTFKITRLDKMNRIVSGEFSFEVVDASMVNPSSAIIKVTEGRFDLKY